MGKIVLPGTLPEIEKLRYMDMNHELTRLIGIKSKAPAFKNEDWGTRQFKIA
jgi:hypothetical protein